MPAEVAVGDDPDERRRRRRPRRRRRTPWRVISMSASPIGAPGAISGISSPACIRSATLASRAPSRPPGCRPAKSSGVKARLSISATASASPSASVIVVEVVGARPTEQASGAGGSTSAMSAARSSVEFGLPRHPDQRDAEAPGVGDEVGELRRLAGVGEEEHHVLGGDHPEVAVARLGRVHVERGRAGRGQRRRDLARHVPGLAHAGEDDPAARRAASAPPPRRSPSGSRSASSASAAASIPITRRPVAISCAGVAPRAAARPISCARRCRPRPSRRGRAAPVAAGSRSRPARGPRAPPAPAARRAPPSAGAGRARPRRRTRPAPG